MSRLLDLDAESRRALEFDALLEQVAGEAASAAGRERILRLRPLSDREALEREIGLVRETGERCARTAGLVPGGLPDARPALGRLAVGGAPLTAEELHDLALTLDAARRARAAVLESDTDYEHLREYVAPMPDLDAATRPVLEGVEPGGKIADRASTRLADCRTRLRRLSGRLRRRLETLLRDPHTVGAIQDEFVTQRNGRYVIPVRTDAPHPVKGIVHATSASGATRFVEPLDSVELNNELVQLAEEEREEEQRILDAWADAFRERLPDVRQAFESFAGLDSFQARARFADRAGAALARVVADGPLRFSGLRHPLLEQHLRETDGECVPLDLDLDPAETVLVVSGPNTGGKTVALKSIGLAALMAQSAVPVTARDAVLPLYVQVRADVGDRQSIEADLSTFSGHVTAIAAVLEQRRAPALYLFDEIGSGTDPAEGVALAQAVLEELAGPGVTVVATTHQNALKRWAFGAAEATSAAMEFDAATLRPTYRVLPNVVGHSAGLDIGLRCGLPRGVVGRARELLGAEAGTTEAYMNRLRLELVAVERRAGELDERERAIEQERAADRRRRREGEAQQRAEAGRRLDRELKEFRKQVRRALDSIEDTAARKKAERVAYAAERGLKRDRERLTAEPGAASEAADWPRVEHPEPGMPVHVLSLGGPGTIERVAGKRVEVLVGRMTVTVGRDDLRLPPRSGRDPAPRRRPTAPGGQAVGAPRELKLIGMRVDEALAEIDRSLDRALLDAVREIRLIHGHGTGRLRAAVRDHLRGHPSIEQVRPGGEHEGGDGATIARLK